MRIWSLIFAGACLASATAFAYDESRDAVVVDPEHHVVVLENEPVRVIEARAGVGATSPMHCYGRVLPIDRTAVTMRRGQSSATEGLSGERAQADYWRPRADAGDVASPG